MLQNTSAETQTETFASLLERLAAVIADTQHHVGNADKIVHVTEEAVQQLGFVSNSVSATSEGKTQIDGTKQAINTPTSLIALHRLDALINQLGYTNQWLERVNNDTDNLRTALQRQL